jgi:hypothetical protein
MWWQAIKAGSVNQKNVLPAVVIIIYEGSSASGGFQKVAIPTFITVDHAYVETGLLRHICKPYPHAFISPGYSTNLAGYSAADHQQANND